MLMTLIFRWTVPLRKEVIILTQYAIRVPADSNFNFLVFMYFLPEDLII